MNKKILSKILAVMLVITLTLANFIYIAVYAVESNYEEQETNINKTGISFDAYFVSDTGVKTHTKVTEMNNSELKLFLSVSVTKGYLKEPKVSIENSNFKLTTGEELPEGVEVIDTDNNTVVLKQINKGENKEIILPIEVIKDEQFNLNNFSKEAKVKLNGTFVNDAAKEKKVEKTILVNLSLSENAEAHLDGIISKFVAFEEEGKKKELLQLTVSSNVVDNLLPIKETEINIEVPTLHGLNPEYISVFATSTKATNGNSDVHFEIDNYVYESNIITLKVQNEPDDDNIVTWLKNDTDEYIINLVYGLEEGFVSDQAKVPIKIASKLSLYNNEEKIIESTIDREIELPEASKGIVSFEIKNEVNEIAKGYMLVKDAANTEYTQNIEVNIGYSPIVNNIEINKGSEYYSDNTEKQYSATTYYKKIEISKDNFLKLLGEDGKIEVITGEKIIATLSAENTEYVFNEEISEVKMIASAPREEGTLVIKTQKYIKAAEYDANVVSTLNKMTTAMIGKSNLTEEQSLAETKLIEPTLQVTSSISNNKLSTVVENENVELRVALQTNNNTNRLFKNPIIEIELPSYIKEVEVKDVNLLYNTELVATHGEISTNANGNKVITVKLEGEQTKFNEVLSVEGITLIIGTDLIVDKTTPSIIQQIKVKVTNNEAEVVETNTQIEYVAPTGMILLNSVSGYNEKNETVTSMSGNEEVGKLTVAGNSRVATQTMTIINNNNYTCGEIQILGKTPTQGNKDILNEQDSGSTFTAKMVSTIRAIEGIEDKDITVYYSEKENTTEDINDDTNGWTTNKEEISEVSSYLIVLTPTMEKGDKIAFSYDIEIPEGLKREQSTYSMYKVNYTNMDGALQGVKDTAKSSVVGISTGEGTELEVDLSANVENGVEVKEGQIIEYTIKVKNTGNIIANEIEVLVDIPKYSYYVEKQMDVDNEIYVVDNRVNTYSKTIETIEPGRTEEIKFMLKVGHIVEYNAEDFISRLDYETDEEYEEAIKEFEETMKEENSTDVRLIARAKVIEEGEEIIFASNELVNNKTEGYFELKLDTEGAQYKAGNYQRYNLFIYKLGSRDYQNVRITCEIPEGLKYISSNFNSNAIKEQVNERTVTWIIDELEHDEIIEMQFLMEGTGKDTTYSLEMIGTCDEYNGEIKSNADVFTLGTPKLELGHISTNTVGYLTEGDQINYTLTVKNTSDVNAYDVKITDYVSDGLMLSKIKYSKGTEVIELENSRREANITIDILAHETLIIELTAKATSLRENEQTKTVTNMFEVVSPDIEKITSQAITHTVNKRKYVYDEDEEPVITYSISGLAWLDENKNGMREQEEKVLSGITVILLSENGKAVSSTITGENGGYLFSNLIKGNYIVTFLYDMANYDVTLYQVGEATADNDTVMMKLNKDGAITSCAATNVISLLSGNVNNVDLGLVISPKFDLSLEKTITRVTIQNPKETKTKTYNNSTLQKIEISSSEINDSTVAIEYLITVKNDGAVAGYAKRVVDYLSSTDLKFNSETNSDWYLGTDGNLYNSSLADTLLQPGESATLKLVLTKKVSESNTGITNNTAEIYEAFNDEGIDDYNSTPANKVSNEKDLGQADIIIGIKTGIVLYLATILTFMAVLTAGIYMLNKKVIKRL